MTASAATGNDARAVGPPVIAPAVIASPAIAVGGIAGFPSLADPASTTALRASGRSRLYIHNSAWDNSDAALRQRVLSVFDHAADVELAIWPDPAHWFANEWVQHYAAFGVKPLRAHVNGFDPARWASFVQPCRAVGFSAVCPIVAPNSREWVAAPFEDERWNPVRDGARLGGGLTVDCPSHFYLAQEPGYRDFVAAELRWARAQGLAAVAIVSPGPDGATYLQDTQRLVADLAARRAMPDEFVVENYEPHPKPGYVGDVGAETEPQSETAVALWLARNT